MDHVRGGGVLSIIVLAAFLGPFGGNMILPMFKPLKLDFGVDILVLGALITVYMLPFSFVQLFAGVLSDVFFGRRLIIVTGFILYGLGGILAAISINIWILLISRIVQGIGNALSIPIIMALVGDMFSFEWRGKIMGLLSISTTLGITLGPLFGGFISTINWRWGFVTISLFSIILGLFSIILLPKRERTVKGDLAAALNVLKYNLTMLSVLVLGWLGFTIFFTRISILTYLSEILTLYPYNLSEERIGSLLSLVGFGGIVSGAISGYLTDRIGRKPVAIFGLSFLIPVFLLYATSYWYNLILYILFIQGFLSTVVFTSINTLAVEVNPEHRATVASIYGSMRFLGYAIGPILSYPFYHLFSIMGVAILSVFLIMLSVPSILWVKSK